MSIQYESERWMPITDVDGFYEISNHGRFRNVKTGRILKPCINGWGYYQIRTCIDYVKRTFFVARLVAKAFVPNPDNLPEVNHKDGDKLNNHISNLEWVSGGDNQRHAYRTGLRKAAKGAANKLFGGYINVYDKRTGALVDRLAGCADMEAKGYNYSNVKAFFKGRLKSYHGCVFVREPIAHDHDTQSQGNAGP